MNKISSIIDEMPGETKADVSGWTVDTSRIDLESRMRERFGFLAIIMGLVWFVTDRSTKIAKIESDKALNLQKMEADRALLLQQSENARHFLTLNHENERTSEWRTQTPNIDRFLSLEKATEEHFKLIDEKLTATDVRAQTAKAIADEAAGALREKKGESRSGTTIKIAMAAVAATLILGFSGIAIALLTNTNTPPPPTTTTTTTQSTITECINPVTGLLC